MYTCRECGTEFEEMKEWSDDDPREIFPIYYQGCPKCGDACVDAQECKRCNKYFEKYEMHYLEYCPECIKEILNDFFEFNVVLEFLTENNLIIDFFFDFYYDCDNSVSTSSNKLKEDMIELYKRKAFDDKITEKSVFKQALVEYLSDDPDAYLELLERKEVI